MASASIDSRRRDEQDRRSLRTLLGHDNVMKKANSKAAEMRAEYDFSNGIRGKYAARYAQGTNVVVLEADVAKVFPNAETVNDSLRALAGIIRRQNKASGR